MTLPQPSTQLLETLCDMSLQDLRCLHMTHEYASWHTQPARTHQQYSITKTFTTLACLRAIDDGLFSLEDKVSDLIISGLDYVRAQPEYYRSIGIDTDLLLTPSYCFNTPLADASLHDLLALRIGHQHRCLFSKERAQFARDNWIERCLSQVFAHQPGKVFQYTNAGHYLAAVIVILHSKNQMSELLQPLLQLCSFHHWDRDPLGFEFGASGLVMPTSGLARFASLILNSLHHSPASLRPLIPSHHIELMSQMVSSPHDTNMNAGYGLGLWVYPDGCISAEGSLGQIVHINPHMRTTFVCNSNTPHLQKIMTLLRSELA